MLQDQKVHSFKYYILSTFLCHKAGTLQDIIIILLRVAMLLALRRPLRHQLLSVHLCPVHFRMGLGHARTFNADGPLNDFKPRTGTYQPLYKAEVAAGQGLARPQPDYEVLHGQFCRLVKFDQLLQLVALGHRMFGPNILGPE